MGKRTAGKQNSGGVTPPQEGKITRTPSNTPAQIRSGRAPEISRKGYPGMNLIKAGGLPVDVGRQPGKSNRATAPESHVRSGTDPTPSGMVTKGATKGKDFGGQVGTNNLMPGGTGQSGKTAVDKEQNLMDVGRRYAKGGKVNRHGSDGRVVKPALPDRTDNAAPAHGGNGGIPGRGGQAPIPLEQPGGIPSTGITASGRMMPSGAGVDTNGITADSGGPVPRSAVVKRVGRAPSLPRPMR